MALSGNRLQKSEYVRSLGPYQAFRIRIAFLTADVLDHCSCSVLLGKQALYATEVLAIRIIMIYPSIGRNAQQGQSWKSRNSFVK
jgi:hypothetical protein